MKKIYSTLFYIAFVALALFMVYNLLCICELAILHYNDNKIQSDCTIKNKKLLHISELKNAKSAGCLIQDNDSLLFIEGAFSVEDIRRYGKLLFPGGTRKGDEPIACTAMRETKEETGIDVDIKGVARVMQNGFVLFHCDTVNELSEKDLLYSKLFEIRKLHLIKIDSIVKEDPSLRRRFRYDCDIDFLKCYYSNSSSCS